VIKTLLTDVEKTAAEAKAETDKVEETVFSK
jgi:hypothetical protein